MAITIRQAIPEDAAALAELHAGTILSIYGADYSQSALSDWSGGHTAERWMAKIGNADLLLAVAASKIEIAGCCGLDLAAQRIGVYVSPKWHRQGIGKMLCEEQIKQAKKQNIKTLRLSAPERAVAFYTSL